MFSSKILLIAVFIAVQITGKSSYIFLLFKINSFFFVYVEDRLISAQEFIISINDLNNAFINTPDKTYVSMGVNYKRVKITCSKNIIAKEGTIQIFLNEKNIEPLSTCTGYYPGLFGDIYCRSKTVEVDLGNYNSIKSIFEIECKIAETGVSNIKQLYKLCK